MSQYKQQLTKSVMLIADKIFASTRRALFISIAVAITGIMYFGFWLWMFITLVVLLGIMLFILYEQKKYPIT
jgi:uncharacterized membrane protein